MNYKVLSKVLCVSAMALTCSCRENNQRLPDYQFNYFAGKPIPNVKVDDLVAFLQSQNITVPLYMNDTYGLIVVTKEESVKLAKYLDANNIAYAVHPTFLPGELRYQYIIGSKANWNN